MGSRKVATGGELFMSPQIRGDMKIIIKKKYITFVTFNLCLALGYWHFKILLGALSHYGFVGWIYPILFLFSFTWTVLYFKELRDKHKQAREVAKEVADKKYQSPTNGLISPETVQDEVQNHLVNKVLNEAYTINFISGRVIFTSTWEKQSELEKDKYKRPVPEIIERQLNK